MQYFTFPAANIDYTKTEKKILDFLFQSPTDILLLSISELASKLGTSESTISRFTRHLGYKDYKDLKSDLMLQMNESHTPAEKLSKSLVQSDFSTVAGVMRHQQLCIGKTIDYIDETEIKAIVTAILSARKIYIFGKGASASLASFTKFRLSRFGLDTEILPSGGSEIFESLNFVKPEDFIIIFGFLKTPREAQIILEHRKTIRYKTLLISSRLSEEEQDQTDYKLYVFRGEPTEYHSMSAPMALIDALVIQIASAHGALATEALNSLHQLKEHYRKELPR